MPSPRVLRVDVDFDEPDSDEEDEVDDLEEQDENSCSNAALEKELKVFFADCENFVKSHMGQNPSKNTASNLLAPDRKLALEHS